MKRIAALLSICAIAALAAIPFPPKVSVVWKWSPNPADFGGLTTNDYYTNILFILYSSPNCTIPTNLWPVTTNWQASTFPSTDGVNWTNSVNIDGATRFYMISVANGNGGASPFSSVAPWLPTPPPGTNPRVLNP